jgi:hypothetical protein
MSIGVRLDCLQAIRGGCLGAENLKEGEEPCQL